MAEFTFYSTEYDRPEILGAVFSCGNYRVVPSLEWPTPSAPEYSSVCDEVLACLAVNSRIFIFGEFTESPPHFDDIVRDDEAPVYSLNELWCGPVLSLRLPRLYTEDGQLRLNPGSFWHQPWYFPHEGGTAIKPPELLRTHYRAIRSCIKSVLTKQTLSRTIWLARDAWRRVASASLKVNVMGKWLGVESVENK